MSPLLQERATPAAAQPLQPLPLGEEQQQFEREDSDSDSSSGSENVCVLCLLAVVGVASERQPLAVCCVLPVLCVMSSVVEASL